MLEDSSTPILCPLCRNRLGSVIENGLYLLRLGHQRAVVGRIVNIKCRKPIDLPQGRRGHCPGIWVPEGEHAAGHTEEQSAS